MAGKIVLVTGGARSGKSSFAEKYVATHGEKIAYIATAQVYDEEMRYRVNLHKDRRPENWKCIEAPYLAEFATACAYVLDVEIYCVFTIIKYKNPVLTGFNYMYKA